MDKNLKLAIVGATGLVGREIISVLQERRFDVLPDNLILLASGNNAGETLEFNGEEVETTKLEKTSFTGVDVAIFAVNEDVSAKFLPYAIDAGAFVIDLSSKFRLDKNAILAVPEVNAEQIRKSTKEQILVSPNSAVVQLSAVLKPILDNFGLKRVVVSALLSASSRGKFAMDELWEQTCKLYNQEDIGIHRFPHQIAFNLIPQTGEFIEGGLTQDEQEIIDETRLILGVADLNIFATAVQVPVFSCCSETVNIETDKDFNIDELETLLRESPGIMILDDPEKKQYPIPVDVAGSSVIFVGRIKRDIQLSNVVSLWIVADNLLKGAAVNAVQIAELVIEKI